MIPTPLEAVIFDMDGTLLDTEGPVRTAIFEACIAMGYEMTDALHLRLVGISNEAGHAILSEHFGPGFEIVRFREHCVAGIQRQFAGGVALKPGALELLGALKQLGIPRGLATSTGRRTAIAQLDKAGILKLFDAVVTRDDVTEGKPHPEPFLRAAELLGVRPAHCVALEDSHNGVRSASAAGMATIMVPDLLPATDEMRGLCVAVAENLDGVRRLIERR